MFDLEKQPCHLLSVFELMLLENVIVTHVIDGQSNHAIKEVSAIKMEKSPEFNAVVRHLEVQ